MRKTTILGGYPEKTYRFDPVSYKAKIELVGMAEPFLSSVEIGNQPTRGRCPNTWFSQKQSWFSFWFPLETIPNKATQQQNIYLFQPCLGTNPTQTAPPPTKHGPTLRLLWRRLHLHLQVLGHLQEGGSSKGRSPKQTAKRQKGIPTPSNYPQKGRGAICNPQTSTNLWQTLLSSSFCLYEHFFLIRALFRKKTNFEQKSTSMGFRCFGACELCCQGPHPPRSRGVGQEIARAVLFGQQMRVWWKPNKPAPT